MLLHELISQGGVTKGVSGKAANERCGCQAIVLSSWARGHGWFSDIHLEKKMGSRMLVLLLSAFVLGQSARAADPHFFESFSTGLDKWVASADPKFSGKLEAATPPGFTDDQAAKVGSHRAAQPSLI